MNAHAVLMLLLIVCSLSGVTAWWQWRRRERNPEDLPAYVHGVAAACVLIGMLLMLDNQNPGDKPLLIGIFFSIATGMLLFLQRQRQQRHSNAVLGLHLLSTGLALIALGVKFV